MQSCDLPGMCHGGKPLANAYKFPSKENTDSLGVREGEASVTLELFYEVRERLELLLGQAAQTSLRTVPAIAKEGEGSIEKMAKNEKKISSYSASVTGTKDLYCLIFVLRVQYALQLYGVPSFYLKREIQKQ